MFIYQEETREKEKEIHFCGFPRHSDVGREDLHLKTWILTLVFLNICFLFQKWGHPSCLFQFPCEAKRNSPCGNIFLTTKPHITVMLLLQKMSKEEEGKACLEKNRMAGPGPG